MRHLASLIIVVLGLVSFTLLKNHGISIHFGRVTGALYELGYEVMKLDKPAFRELQELFLKKYPIPYRTMSPQEAALDLIIQVLELGNTSLFQAFTSRWSNNVPLLSRIGWIEQGKISEELMLNAAGRIQTLVKARLQKS